MQANPTQQRLSVDLGTRSYPIHIGAGLISQVDKLLPELSQQVFVVTNSVVAPLYLPILEQALVSKQLVSYQLPDGETAKTLEHYQATMTALLAAGFNRDCTVVALGGGVVGDLAGFVAATFQRGVAFVQMPTTLLAQVDSSVGGKTAVNHPQGKNMIGAFHQPDAVIIDSDCLQTLPSREVAAGLAEVIKYGVMADGSFFDWLEQHISDLVALEPTAINHAIARSCELKAKVVADDEREQGSRALLNLGHTFGHAIETLAGYGTWLHGEAVATGMCMAAELASRTGRISTTDYQRIVSLIERAGLPVKAPATWSTTQWFAAMSKDKKVKAGQLRLVLPTAIGSAELCAGVAEADITAAIARHTSGNVAG